MKKTELNKIANEFRKYLLDNFLDEGERKREDFYGKLRTLYNCGVGFRDGNWAIRASKETLKKSFPQSNRYPTLNVWPPMSIDTDFGRFKVIVDNSTDDAHLEYIGGE